MKQQWCEHYIALLRAYGSGPNALTQGQIGMEAARLTGYGLGKRGWEGDPPDYFLDERHRVACWKAGYQNLRDLECRMICERILAEELKALNEE